MVAGLTCNACNKQFIDETTQKIHYKSQWHRYNLKRKIAGVPGVTEALFLVRQSALAEEISKLNEPTMLYTCGLCGKGYRSYNAHAQHLKSRAHTTWASQANHQDESTAIIKPLAPRMANEVREYGDEESDGSDEWEEVDQDVDVSSLNQNEMDGSSSDMDEDVDESEMDPTGCFMCDKEHNSIESCMIHLHKSHGFFIPDVEYLKDPSGFLTYLGLRVKRDYMCLYCSSSQPFNSLEAVRKHMVAKSHCKVHYGDGDEGEAELDEFYDYSSSYVDGDEMQLMTLDVGGDHIELGSGGSELIITRSTDDGILTKAIGSREYLRFYRQKPRPSQNNIATTAVVAARYRSMGLSTVQSKENLVRMKVIKQMNRSGVEVMRSEIGMKSNVIRNLPKNVTH